MKTLAFMKVGVRMGEQNDPGHCLVLDPGGHATFEPVPVSLTCIFLAAGCLLG